MRTSRSRLGEPAIALCVVIFVIGWQFVPFHMLPQLQYAILKSLMLMLVGLLIYFDLVFVLTGGSRDTTRFQPVDMYLSGFSNNGIGRASTLAVLCWWSSAVWSWAVMTSRRFHCGFRQTAVSREDRGRTRSRRAVIRASGDGSRRTAAAGRVRGGGAGVRARSG